MIVRTATLSDSLLDLYEDSIEYINPFPNYLHTSLDAVSYDKEFNVDDILDFFKEYGKTIQSTHVKQFMNDLSISTVEVLTITDEWYHNKPKPEVVEMAKITSNIKRYKQSDGFIIYNVFFKLEWLNTDFFAPGRLIENNFNLDELPHYAEPFDTWMFTNLLQRVFGSKHITFLQTYVKP